MNRDTHAFQVVRRRGHETRDAGVRRIVIVAVVLAVSVPLLMALIWLMCREFAGDAGIAHLKPVLGIDASVQSKEVFPEPQVRPVPAEQPRIFREKEAGELDSYGWIDRSRGIVRIPINRAMEILAQRGLPTRSSNMNESGRSEYELIQERTMEIEKTKNK
jgi:hypothetical protein